MVKIYGILLCTCLVTSVCAQKKPLDHSVYDKWESVGERKISNDGKWIAYVKAVQEGDNASFLRSVEQSSIIEIPRGYNINFSESGKYAYAMIAAPYGATRQAKIQKKKPEEMPKDSLAIIDLTVGAIRKVPNVRTYSLPLKADALIAYHLAKISDTSKKAPSADTDTGTDLIIENMDQKILVKASDVSEFEWSKNGKLLMFETRAAAMSKTGINGIVLYRTFENRFDTICKGGNEFGNFAIDDNAYQVAFTAERDSSRKALVKTHKLWYWKNGMDTAIMLIDKNHQGVKLGMTISEFRKASFSESGNRLYFGLAAIKPAKDTATAEIDKVKVDIWHYQDDRLQPQQLVELNNDLKRNYLAMYDLTFKRLLPLGDEYMKTIILPAKGDAHLAIGLSDTARRKEFQWKGEILQDVYAIDLQTGNRKLVTRGLSSTPQLSPLGLYISWYDDVQKQFFTWKDGITVNISKSIPFKLYDEEHDTPNDPPPYARMRWLKQDAGLLLSDRFDIWRVDPSGKSAPLNVTQGSGRRSQLRYTYAHPQPDEDWLPGVEEKVYMRVQHDNTKEMGYSVVDLSGKTAPFRIFYGPYAYSALLKSRDADILVYTKETFTLSPQLVVRHQNQESVVLHTNPQQSDYNWGTVELFNWKAYDGKTATGMVFKPENMVPGKKYPMISYFYERDSDGLFLYRAPAPTPSRLNITFFVSRGYIVFVPDIHYQKGYPGKGAYDYIVSGSRALVKKGWVDSTKIGIQGQSWGGYQICYLITRTHLFSAAWAGAPVANMTSAYGGIRWGTGLNRQFQYEKTQSRIGATLWEKPELYIENSPLFKVPFIKTPLVMMANDEDDAVPWYQGIEMFTAMRRLDKKVWLLNYNGEKHNLVERKNRKDISIREQQFFDWLLKGEKPPRWLSDGVPATEKHNVNL
ncbi:MAG: alpha/beta hydrolase family protein [Sphingobacteriales bacterium]|jgi:dipeptidyl aminopeptidase/acylaminoacyl peptidase